MNKKQTSQRAARKASALLRSKKTTSTTKSVAGSALSQTKSKKK